MWLSVWVFVGFFLRSRSFNVDVNIPVVRQGDQLGSYFGFSVAEHGFTNPRTNSEERWILVGAPKANTSNLLTNFNIVNTGAVYKCDLKLTTCEQIPYLNSENEKNVAGVDIEDQSNMWLGVSLTSALNGAVLACAHRYVYKTRMVNYHMYPGKCFTGKNDLRRITNYDECLNRNLEDAQSSGSVATHERYQYCQMGVSSTYIPTTQEPLFGGPGTTNYQGSIFYDSKKEITYRNGVIGYQGYSVSYGSFFTKNEEDVVTGAPRENHHGIVVVFSKSDEYQTRKVIFPPKVDDQRQPGSGFGSSVAGIDVNGDGWTDILIGAPYYSVKGSVNEGRVYVYMNKGNGDFEEQPLELQPTVFKNMAHFGHVVSRIGDIDQDGFEDVGIGAPYEEKTGLVYIFNGSADGITKKPAQVIKPSDLNENMETFGYSIAGRVDMDGNGYPDLLIGAFKSDKVALLRSRPIIDMQSTITITPNPFDARATNCKVKYQGKDVKTACMSATVCLGYKERKNQLKDPLSVDLLIESDVEYKKKARVLFNSTAGSVYKKTLTKLPLHPAKICFEEYVFLRNDVEDVYPDIAFRIYYKMHQPKTPPTSAPQQLPSLSAYAMLEEQKQTFASALLMFKRDCVKCVPNLAIEQTSAKTLAVGGVGFPMDISVSNNGESAYNTELHITIPDGVSVATVEDTTDSSKKPFSISHLVTSKLVENDNTTKVSMVPIANPLKNKGKKRLRVSLNTGGFSKSEDFLPIELKVVSVNPEPPQQMADNVISLNVSIVSKADLQVTGYRGHAQEQVLYGGTVVGESAMLSEEDIGNEVKHIYVVQNLGPDLVPEAEIVIQWPYETKNGKHLLYLMEVLVTGRGQCHFLPDQINLLGLRQQPKSSASGTNDTEILAQENLVRKRRDLHSEKIQAQESKEKRETAEPIKKGGRANIILDCQAKDPTARCTPIRCTMTKLSKGDEVKFTIRSRLWNGTFLEDYYGEYAQVISRAKVRTLVTFVQEQNPDNNQAMIITQINPGFTATRKAELPAWVIPVAVVGAILVLVIIILILWKLGFFKRKKFDGNITDAEREEMMKDSKKEKQPFD